MGAWCGGNRVRVPTVGLLLSIVMAAAASGVSANSAQAEEGVTGPPSIEHVSATPVTPKRATLEATIDPNGLETKYEFRLEFGCGLQRPEPGPGQVQCESIGLVTVGGGQIAAGYGGQTVSLELTSLSPGNIYDYWVVATNSAGSTETSHGGPPTGAECLNMIRCARARPGEFVMPPAPVSPVPEVDSESISDVTTGDATPQAQINPEGQAAYYQFQIVAEPSEFASEIECPLPTGPLICLHTPTNGVLPIGYLPASSEDQSVSLNLAQAGVTLKSDTTYHYRVIVAPAVQTEDTIEWKGPSEYGADQTFTTTSGPSPPSIEAVSLSHLTSTDATLEAEIDTEGLETAYQFKLWASPCAPDCELIEDVPLPSGKLLGSFVDQSISLDLNSAGVTLTPGGEYGYSVSAASSAGSVEGEWQKFIAPGPVIVPLKGTTSTGGSPSSGSGTQTPGSQAPSSSSTPLAIAPVLLGHAPASKAPVKGHLKAKRSVERKKHKRHKSRTTREKHPKTRKG
jgi:hypothetical protein